MNETARQDTATFDGSILSGVRHYDYPSPHSEEPRLELVPMDCGTAHYWSACNGVCQAWRAITPGLTCIATVDTLLREVTGHHPYVIWKPKTVTAGVIRKWVSKWGGRTVQIEAD